MRVRHGLLHPSPAYVWRPSQILRRLTRKRSQNLVTLPWGLQVRTDTLESIGAGIARLGIHELAVSEMMWRLADETDLTLDVGANIGYFTSLLASRSDRVIAFEPHPLLIERLRENVTRWPSVNVDVEGRAASSETGSATLSEPMGFFENAGTAGIDVAGARSFEIETVRLDDVIGEAAVGVLKIDVEGHELQALKGLKRALAERRVRDIFFEELEELPTPASERLVGYGYHLFSLRQRIDRVLLESPPGGSRGWEAPTYLATLNPDRVQRRARGIGWRCLRGKSRPERITAVSFV